MGPLFGLRVETPRLVLRPARDEDLEGLADAAIRSRWRAATGGRGRGRAPATDGRWLVLAVGHEGRLIGSQDVVAADSGALRADW